MMQEEGTTSTEPAVPSAAEEKKDDAEIEAEEDEEPTEAATPSAAEASIADKTKEIMKDLTIDKPKQIFADFQGMATSFKEKLKPAEGQENAAENHKLDPMEKSRQFFSDMKEKATSFKGFSLAPTAGSTPNPDADLDVTADGSAPTEGPTATTNDPLERSKEFFADMKVKATSFKMKLGEPKLDQDGNPIPSPLDRVKADMEGFKQKMAPQPKFDEYGKQLPGPLDRMKADMEGFAAGIGKKMGAINTRAASTTTNEDENTNFTISEEEDAHAAHPPKPTNELLSMKFNDFMQSAKTTANDSLNHMPKLTFFGNNQEAGGAFNLGDKFSAFRHSTIDPLSQKLGMKKEQGTTEGIDFGAEPTIVDIPPPAAPAATETATTDYV